MNFVRSYVRSMFFIHSFVRSSIRSCVNSFDGVIRLACFGPPLSQVMHIFMQVAKGLQYVHACGLIHRDLKPANCFLMAEGTVKIGVRVCLEVYAIALSCLPAYANVYDPSMVKGMCFAGGDRYVYVKYVCVLCFTLNCTLYSLKKITPSFVRKAAEG